ncbi:uncharacterized protein OCT59_023416 [Rhizophagus irregularis]|uniref:Sel1 repeat domain-containing protein n=2 Tax=Rhizophagus irregularis TaxID=588596 RepID=A0A015J455_RHIIW|nr:hypothetical protein RirG_144400 [Rhizophagus irregularis DAOM 197198w]UZO03003.1 hypothetical protein OCT59_023416 [Rhizophagus irregularis]
MSDIIVEKQSTYKYYQTENYNFKLNKQQLIQNLDNIDASTINDPLCTELSKNIQNFFKINIMEIGPTIQDIKENIFEEDLSILIDKLVKLYFRKTANKGKEEKAKKKFVLDYLNNNKINLQEIHKWLIDNQNSSNSIYLLGYFNYHGIFVETNKQIALELYQKAVELENVVAQFELAYMYYYGIDVDRSYYNAFKLFEKLSEKDNPRGMKWLGYCYEFGFGTEKNVDKAVYWYKKSADKGSKYAQNKLKLFFK